MTPEPADAAEQPGLAARQAELVAALVAGGAVPPGFDRLRIEAARRALVRKRAGEAAKAWPLLAASCGADWPHTFAVHRADKEPVGALRDGWEVARDLHRRGELNSGAAAELTEREAAFHYDGDGDPGPAAASASAGPSRSCSPDVEAISSHCRERPDGSAARHL